MDLEAGMHHESEGLPLSASVKSLLTTAQDEATARRHQHLGPEHLLLGLCNPRDSADSPLLSLGVNVEQLHTFVSTTIGQGNLEAASSGTVTSLTGRARRALTLASVAAQEFGHHEVQLADVVVGLTREGHNIAAQLLIERGVTADRAVDLARMQH